MADDSIYIAGLEKPIRPCHRWTAVLEDVEHNAFIAASTLRMDLRSTVAAASVPESADTKVLGYLQVEVRPRGVFIPAGDTGAVGPSEQAGGPAGG